MTGFKSKKQAAMNKREMTPWFPVEIHPVHIGVYEVKNCGVRGQTYYAKWDGGKWCYTSDSVTLAHQQKHESWVMYHFYQDKKPMWRGFTNEQ